jgi:hypothetical protein
MNLNGFAPEASINLLKTFIRPVYEYGWQIRQPNNKDYEVLQKVQNLALRTLLSAPRNTSILAMHKILHLPNVRTRLEKLRSCFLHKLGTSSDDSILAVKYIKGNENLRRSLINNDWINITKTEEKRMILKSLIEDNGNRNGKIAATFKLQEGDKLRYVLTNRCNKKVRQALVRWMYGGVAHHQPCCKCRAELSRQHASECSGAHDMLMNAFPNIENHGNETLIDAILNKYSNGSAVPNLVLDKITQAIYQIYRTCLNFENATDGIWRPKENSDSLQRRTYARKRPRLHRQVIIPSGPVGRPRGRNR